MLQRPLCGNQMYQTSLNIFADFGNFGTAGCQVGGHLKKGWKRGHFTGKEEQEEDIFFFKPNTKEAKKHQIYM